jgi:hypothetical protein
MTVLYLLVRKRKQIEVSTEVVNKPDTSDELSRFYDKLLAELESDPEDVDIYAVDLDNEDEHPQLMMLIRS